MAQWLGVEIHSRSVRAALAQSRFGRVEIHRYLEVGYAESPALYDGTTQIDLQGALVQLLKDAGEVDAISVALSGDKLSLRTLDVPQAASKKLLSVLPFELEPLLPFSVDEAVVDYQVIRKDRQIQRLLVVSALRKYVTDLLGVYREAGIEPKEIAAGAPALEGLCEIQKEIGQAQPDMVVFARDQSADIAMVWRGVTLCARTISLTSERYCQGLESAMTQLLTVYRSEEEPKIQAVLQGAMVKTSKRRRSTAKRESQTTASIVPPQMRPHLWISGETRCLEQVEQAGHLVGLASSRIRLPEVSELAPELPTLTGVTQASIDSRRLRFAYVTALAVRAAMRHKRFNLRQGDFAFKQTIGVLRAQLKLLGVCAIGITLAVLFSSVVKWQSLKQQNAFLTARLAAESRSILGTETTDLEKLETILAPTTQQDDPLPKIDVFDVLGFVSDKVPETTVHNARLLLIELPREKAPGRVELEGTVPTIAKRDEIAANLLQHPCLRDLQKGRVSPTVDNTGVNYQMEAVLRCGSSTATNSGSKVETKTEGGSDAP